MATKEQIKYRRYIYVAVMTLGAILIALHQPFTYDADSYFISMVINGCYSATDNYVKYLHPLFCRVLFYLHKLFPSADWFTLFVRIMLVVGIGWISYWISVRVKDWIITVIIGFCILATAAAGNVFGANFTVYAAIFSFFGVFSIFTSFSLETGRKLLAVGGTAFLALGLMIRSDGALLVIPFVGLKVFIDFISSCRGKRGQTLLRDVKLIAVPVVIVASLLLSNWIFWSSPARADEIAYNTNSSPLINYPVKPWTEIQEYLPGVSENDYTLIRSWNFSDTDILNSEYYGRIAEVASIQPEWNLENLSTANQTVLKILRSWSVAPYTIWLLFLFFNLICSKLNRYERLEYVLAICSGYVIMLYFAVRGRFPERVCIAICLPMIAILFNSLLNAASKMEPDRPKVAILTVIAVLIAGVYLHDQYPMQKQIHLSCVANTTVDEENYRAFYQEDTIYLCDGIYLMRFSEQDRLPSKEYFDHFVSKGDWTYGQAYHKDYLKRLGISNPMRSLLTRDKTYFLGNDPTLVLRFLQEHYEPDTAVKEAGNIDGTPLWQFYTANGSAA